MERLHPRMALLLLSVPVLCIPMASGGLSNQKSAASMSPNTLTAEEKAQGWVLLFDGGTFNGWRGLGRDRVPEKHWIVEDGAIKQEDVHTPGILVDYIVKGGD